MNKEFTPATLNIDNLKPSLKIYTELQAELNKLFGNTSLTGPEITEQYLETKVVKQSDLENLIFIGRHGLIPNEISSMAEYTPQVGISSLLHRIEGTPWFVLNTLLDRITTGDRFHPPEHSLHNIGDYNLTARLFNEKLPIPRESLISTPPSRTHSEYSDLIISSIRTPRGSVSPTHKTLGEYVNATNDLSRSNVSLNQPVSEGLQKTSDNKVIIWKASSEYQSTTILLG